MATITGAQLAAWYLDDPPRVPATATWVKGRRPGQGHWSLTVRHCIHCGDGPHEHFAGYGLLPEGGSYRARCWGGRVYHVVITWQSPSRASCRKAVAAKRREDEARAAKRRSRAGAGRRTP